MLAPEEGISTVPAFMGERRRGRRFNLRLNCRVSLLSMKSMEVAGQTVNISRSGVLVSFEHSEDAEQLKDPQEPVRIVIELPQNPHFSPRYLECMGHVARVTEEEHTWIAFEIGRMQVTGDGSETSASKQFLSGLRIGGATSRRN